MPFLSQTLRAAALASLLLVAGAGADDGDQTVAVPLYKSVTLPVSGGAATRVSVGNPGVADFVVLDGNSVQVVGKALGSTNVTLWNGSKVKARYDIEVTHDLSKLKQKLHELLPDDGVEVQSAQENVVLSGQASSLSRMQAAVDLAQSFIAECIEGETTATGSKSVGGASSALPGAGKGRDCDKGKVINLMQVGGAQQVMLEIKVAEIARTVLKSLDANLSIVNLGRHGGGGVFQGGASFPNALDPNGLKTPVLGALNGHTGVIGPPVAGIEPSTPTIDSSGILLSYLKGDMFLNAVLDISRRKGLAKILSEPTLTTLNGQEAEFLSGGEFPLPVPQGGNTNTITVEFKEFGVGVKFLPVVLDNKHINLKLNVSVSELSQDNNLQINTGTSSTAYLIPSLTKRSAMSTVELGDGQTIGIAGLISDSTREFVDKLPGLGDIPGLGALFRSQQFQSGQTELVIFVTPHLAKPLGPGPLRLPTDSFVPPSDLAFYLMGDLEGARDAAHPHSSKGGAEGVRFGHDLSTGGQP